MAYDVNSYLLNKYANDPQMAQLSQAYVDWQTGKDPSGSAYARLSNSVGREAAANFQSSTLGFMMGGRPADYDSVIAKPAGAASPGSQSPAKDIKIDTGMTNGLRNINAEIKYDSSGRPVRNDYLSITDANGQLLPQFQMAGQIGPDVQLNTQGLDAIRNRALSTGPSAWAQLATQQQQMDESNQINKANRQVAAGQNQQFNMLAAKGGMSAGQRERLARMGANQQFSGVQNIRNTGMGDRLKIGLQDQTQKDQFLSQLPGQELNAANFFQQQRAYTNQAKDLDIQRALRDAQGLNAYRADAYGEAMKGWASDKAASAQSAAAGGGGKK